MGWIISAVVAMGSFLAWFTSITIKTQLGDFKDSLRKEFGERFLDATLAAAKLEPMQRDITMLREKINQVEVYAHDSAHELRNQMQTIRLEKEKGPN